MASRGTLASVLGLVLPVLTSWAFAEDWPAYQKDASCSAITAEKLKLPLVKIWAYEPTQAPRPAWPEPGKELHRLDFDYAFQPVAAGGLVYFGSSADDTVRALDAAAGTSRWRFTAGGPIRFAPAIAGGKAYVASDDGFLYCLDAATGKEAWRFRAAPSDEQFLGNGRMISRWPLRSGVLVADGAAYVAAGMWPSQGIYVYALDAETGKVLWCNDSSGSMYINLPHPGSSAFTGVAPQGYLAASKDLLLVPTGRSVPAAYDRKTGRLVYYRPSFSMHSGGCWTAIAGELFFNSRHPRQLDDEARIGEAEPRRDDGMAAYKLATGELELDIPTAPTALANGDTLYGVGGGNLQAIDLRALRKKRPVASCIEWKTPHPRAYCMALADGVLLVGGRDSVTAFDAASGKQAWRADVEGQVRGMAVADGRLVIATQRGTIACFEHRRVAGPPAQQRERLEWQLGVSDKCVGLASEVIRKSGVTKGCALVIDGTDGRLAAAVASRTDLHVLSVLRGTDKVAAERERILSTDLYGTRLVVQGLKDPGRLPYAPYFADLVLVSGETGDLSGEELYRVLRPCGGILCFADVPPDAARKLLEAGKVPSSEVRASGESVMVVRGPLPGAGEWRYPVADGGRTGVGTESRLKLPLDILWFGGPGPDRMLDRHWGAAPPLVVGGRVFVTGQHHVLAYDAYNGRELWCRELRGAGRTGADWCSANFVADDDSLYVAVGTACHRLDQATGRTLAVYAVPEGLIQRAIPKELPPVDVAWPTTWQVFGPVPKGTPPPPRDALKSMPNKLTVGSKTYTPASLDAVEGMLDFTYLYGGYGFGPLRWWRKPGPYPRGEPKTDMEMEQSICYAFARIHCPTAGRLIIGAGSDWWMQWLLDGEPIYDTLDGGNDAHPYAITNHVFSTEVAAGDHVLAVLVKAGSRGWCLISAGGAKYAPQLQPLMGGRKSGSWGYLSVAGDLLLGTYVEPQAPDHEAVALFALDRKDGRERWISRASKRILNTSIAFGDGRLFLLDGLSSQEISKAKRAGQKLEPKNTVVALDLAKGAELWRQEGAPPEGFLEYAKGVVVVGSNMAYDAATGKKLWEQKTRAERIPLVHGDWVIAQPNAFNLRTGEQRMAASLLTGERQPWEFLRAYGCGSLAGCQSLLFFRSGAMGFLDLTNDGTTTFGGIKPGCAVHMIPAGGLLLLPESASGCTCSYNFQASLALVPGPARGDAWYAFPGRANDQHLRELHLNLGAPGDRRDPKGIPWLGFPRPAMPGACPVPVVAEGQEKGWFYQPSDRAEVKGTELPWLYTSGFRGGVRLLIDLQPTRPVAAPPCEKPPAVDGRLNDPCWSTAKPVHFDSNGQLLEPHTWLYACRDSENLYFALRRVAVSRHGKAIPLVGNPPGKERALSREDAIELMFTDSKQQVGAHFGLSCGGARFDGTNNLAEKKGTNPAWNGEWTSAARKGAEEWTAEIAIPLKTLAQAKIDPADLQVNVMAQNVSGYGRDRVYLADPGKQGFSRCQRFVPIVAAPVAVPERTLTVRLHFAEPDEAVKAGWRSFDVTLGDQPVLKGFDVVKEAGGARRALVREFKGVKAREELSLTLSPPSTGLAMPTPMRTDETRLPVICAIEILAEDN